MPEKTSSFLKNPQTWIIVILLAVIAAFAFSHFNKPKTNRLQQAAAHFDAIEAEERAEAEKEKARLAEIAAAKAAEEAKVAAQQAKDAEEKLKQQSARVASTYQQAANQPSRYQFVNQESCNRQDQVVSCTITCQDQYGNQKRLGKSAYYVPVSRTWGSYDMSGTYGSLTAIFMAMCSSI